jgi:hypothetical protein
MDEIAGLYRVAYRATVGAMVGAMGGAIAGGLTGQGVGIVLEYADDELAGFGSWMTFAFCAFFAALAAALAGACGAAWRRALPGAVAGLAAGFVVSLYPGLLLWLYDDTSWPYSYFLTGIALMLPATLVGAIAGWVGEPPRAHSA